jgi:hypothetical protein
MGGTGMNVNFVTFLRAEDVDPAEAQEDVAAGIEGGVAREEVVV